MCGEVSQPPPRNPLMPTLPAAAAEEFAAALLTADGVVEAEARQIAASLVAANLRGHDSHGVVRVPQYLEALAAGEVASGVELAIERETETTVVADAGWGFGQVQARRLFDRLVPKARAHGVAAGTLRQCSHVGRLGEYCEAAVEQGLVAMMMVNTHGFARRVAPPGGREPRLGTNPLAFGVPHPQRPIIADFSTSAVAEGKVRVKRNAGQDCPSGWIVDAEGRPTTDPNAIYQDPPGSILPMGGEQAYKGFALSLIVELFAGALSGGVCNHAERYPRNGNCAYLQLIDPAAMGGADHFAGQVAGLVDYLVECPRAPGCEAILLPGDPERNTMAARSQTGLPIDDGTWQGLLDCAGRLGVAAPG